MFSKRLYGKSQVLSSALTVNPQGAKVLPEGETRRKKMKKTLLGMGIAMCMLGLAQVNLAYSATPPTIDEVIVSPGDVVQAGTEVTVTVKATPAHPDDILGHDLQTRNGTFGEWDSLGPRSQYEYFPPAQMKGPGTVLNPLWIRPIWLDADGVFTFTADAGPGKHEIVYGVTVVKGPNQGGTSRTTFHFTVTPAPRKAPAVTLKITQTKLGNVFIEGDPVSFRLETTGGEQIVWNVRDFWGKQVLKGSMDISGAAQLTILLQKKGYFLLEVISRKKSGETAIERTPFAVLSPFDLKTVEDSPFGIQTFFGEDAPTEIIPLIALAGFKNVRDPAAWASIEREKGKYNFAGYDVPMKQLEELTVKPLITVYGTVKHCDNGNTPHTKKGLAAFAQYAQALVKHYRGFVRAVEVWNEYNDPGSCKGPAASKPENYIKMLKAVYPAVKEVSPETRVVGCVATPNAWDWLEKVFQLGGLSYMDAVSVHPYRWLEWHKPPATFDADMARLTKLIAKYNPDNRPRPIWATEVSWPSREDGVSPEIQAEYIVRTYIVLIANGVEKIFWFCMPDTTGSGYEIIMGGHSKWIPKDVTPKPSYVSCAVVTRQLSGADFIHRDKTEEWIRSYLFRKGEEDIRVLWGMRPGTVTIHTSVPLSVTDVMGEEELLQPREGEVYLTLSGSPFYLQGKIDGIKPGGKIHMRGKTKVPTGDKISVKFLLDNSLSPSANLEIEGKERRERTVSILAERAGVRNILYRLKVNNQLVGKGAFTTEIWDPLSLAAVLKAGKGLSVQITNDSKTKEYVFSSLNWKIYRRRGKINRNIAIPPESKKTILIPASWVEAFQAYPVSVHVTFKNGEPLSFSGELKASP